MCMWFYTLLSMYFFCGNTYDMSVIPSIIGVCKPVDKLNKIIQTLVKHAKNTQRNYKDITNT